MASCYYSAVHLDYENIIKWISSYCNQENTRWIKLPGHPCWNSYCKYLSANRHQPGQRCMFVTACGSSLWRQASRFAWRDIKTRQQEESGNNRQQSRQAHFATHRLNYSVFSAKKLILMIKIAFLDERCQNSQLIWFSWTMQLGQLQAITPTNCQCARDWECTANVASCSAATAN